MYNSRKLGMRTPHALDPPPPTTKSSSQDSAGAFSNMLPLANSLGGLAPPALSLTTSASVLHGLSAIANPQQHDTLTTPDRYTPEEREVSPNSTPGTSTGDYEDAENNLDDPDANVTAFMGKAGSSLFR